MPFLSALLLVSLLAQDNTPLIIDTDAGSDDLMAIAFLLSRKDVRIEGITVANGLAHVNAGAANVLRLLELAGRGNVPVYTGRNTPMKGHAEFPAEWRRSADELPGVQLPKSSRKPAQVPAAEFLANRLKGGPARILALGPLTNLAEVLKNSPKIGGSIQQLVIMGGAVHARGNLDDGGFFKTDNKTAEWNLFVDPEAARIVFSSGVPIELIPLDATNKVPIDFGFFKQMQSSVSTPLGRFVVQVLETERDAIQRSFYFAWDPLAAVALVDPRAVSFTPLHLEIRQSSMEMGRTVAGPGQPNAQVALDANASVFRQSFLAALKE